MKGFLLLGKYFIRFQDVFLHMKAVAFITAEVDPVLY